MADRNQLKKAPQPAISDDDPFAELTRIMGFDPREPVAPRQPAAVEKLAALQAEEMDLSIDLEKELMGEFAGLDDDLEALPQDLTASQPATEQAEGVAVADDAEDFDFVFDRDISIPEASVAPEPAISLADELDGPFVTPEERESAVREAASIAFADDEPDDQPEAIAAPEPAAVFAEHAQPYDFDADEQLAAEAPAAEEPVLEEQPAAEEFSMPVEALEEDDPVAAGDHEALAAELETAFADEQLADEPVLDAEPVAEAPAAEEPLPEGEPAVADLPAHEDELLLADEFGDTFAADLDGHLAAVAEEQPVFAVEEFHAEEESVEAELDAVGEIETAPEADYGTEAEAYDDADVVPLIPLSAVRDYAGEKAEPLETALSETAAADDYDLEAELSVLLGRNRTEAVSAPAVEPEAAGSGEIAPAAEDHDEPAALDEGWMAGDVDPAAAEPLLSAAEAEPYLDEPALFADETPAGGEAFAAQDHAPEERHTPEMAAPDADFQAEMEPLQAEAETASQPEEDDPLSEFVVEQELEAELAAMDGDIDLGLEDLDLALDDEPADEPAPQAVEPAARTFAPASVVVPFVAAAAAAPIAQAAPKMPAPPAAEEEEDDPFAILATMMRTPQPIAPPPAQSAAPAAMHVQPIQRSDAPAVSEKPVSSTEYQYRTPSYADRVPVNVPEIDTVDVPESAVALADDLDIPHLAFEDDLPPATDFDDFEAELASAFNQQAAPAPAAAEPVRDVPRQAYRHDYAQYDQPDVQPAHYAGAAAAAAASTAYAAAPRDAAYADDGHYGDAFDSRALAGNQPPEAYRAVDDDDLAYDPELNEAIPAYHEAAQQPSGNRRGLLLAAIVGGVVLVGGIGAYALSSGGGNGSAGPAVVRADTDPVKVRPENPGGATVPNQDSKVFQTMNGADTAAPSQEKLISGAEEPVDMASRAAPRVVTPPQPVEDAQAAEDAPLVADDEVAALADDPVAAEIAAAPKGEERVAPSAEEPAVNNETAAVAPRRVRTMVVRADGTLVPSEDPAPAAATPSPQTTASALEPADPSQSLADPIAPESTGSLKPVAEASAETQVPAPVEAAAAAPQPATSPAAPQSAMPSSGPVAPSRPADQPVDVVGEVKPQQVAAASGAAAAAGGWSMQIASQPSEAAAQASYQDLARRYGSVIGDKGVNIVKAEIAGKGTYWRVRVPAASRNDAISLCESYKAAGGNCFVSK